MTSDTTLFWILTSLAIHFLGGLGLFFYKKQLKWIVAFVFTLAFASCFTAFVSSFIYLPQDTLMLFFMAGIVAFLPVIYFNVLPGYLVMELVFVGFSFFNETVFEFILSWLSTGILSQILFFLLVGSFATAQAYFFVPISGFLLTHIKSLPIFKPYFESLEATSQEV